MVKNFEFWLEGITEDDPLEDEIINIVFKVTFNGTFKSVAMLGFENYFNSNSMPFYPLEAQFYFDKALSKLNDDEFYVKLKNIIDEAFFNKAIKFSFKNRKIFLDYKNKLEFLFKI